MAVIVLVHGAWSGSWSWKGVAPLLRAAGHEVHAPTLTGLAERSHIAPAQVNLSSHIADIAGLLHWNDLRDVILVGHSYGGMVITGAADREIARIKGMIYIDAFVPASGQNVWDMAGPKGAAAQQAAAMAHDGGHSVPRARAPRQQQPCGCAPLRPALHGPSHRLLQRALCRHPRRSRSLAAPPLCALHRL